MKCLSVILIAFIGIAFGEVYFKEEFSDGSYMNRWVESKHTSEMGPWKYTAGKWYGDAEKDMGIQTGHDARFYGISAKFEKPFTNEDKDLVIQFQVKHEQKIDCGGGYLKVYPFDVDQEDLHGESPYYIMFGPDICGADRKVHVIFNYKGKNHLIKKRLNIPEDELSHVYSLVVKSDNTYEVYLDLEKKESGKLEDDWAFLPPKKIKDPAETQPEDWDDREMIDDPEDTKPEDWDSPQYILDPDAKQPEDWDEDIDGEWEPPMIDNPKYKGKWTPKKIENPDYQGKWVHPMIENPDYIPDDKLYLYKDIGAVGIDIWQVKSGTIFDNFFIGDDFEEAKKFAEDTWQASKEGEAKMKEEIDAEEKQKQEEELAKQKEVEEAEKSENAEEEEEVVVEEQNEESTKDEL